MYYIFDNGLKEEDYIKCVKNSTGGTRRRQFGSILYDSDSFKKKDSRQIKVYLPMIKED